MLVSGPGACSVVTTGDILDGGTIQFQPADPARNGVQFVRGISETTGDGRQDDTVDRMIGERGLAGASEGTADDTFAFHKRHGG